MKWAWENGWWATQLLMGISAGPAHWKGTVEWPYFERKHGVGHPFLRIRHWLQHTAGSMLATAGVKVRVVLLFGSRDDSCFFLVFIFGCVMKLQPLGTTWWEGWTMALGQRLGFHVVFGFVFWSQCRHSSVGINGRGDLGTSISIHGRSKYTSHVPENKTRAPCDTRISANSATAAASLSQLTGISSLQDKSVQRSACFNAPLWSSQLAPWALHPDTSSQAVSSPPTKHWYNWSKEFKRNIVRNKNEQHLKSWKPSTTFWKYILKRSHFRWD